MRRDRTGDLLDADEPTTTEADASVHVCDDGWLDDDDRRTPCLVCRPHLMCRNLRRNGL